MPSLAEIAFDSGIENPDFPAILEYLRKQGEPVAYVKNPLKVVSPAVNIIHTRARTLQFELTAKKLNTNRLKSVVTRGFNDITKFYTILHGVEPPSKFDDRQEFIREQEFAEKILEVYYRLLREIGATTDPVWEPRLPNEARREGYSAEVKVLREEYKLPEFAMKENMARRSGCAANFGWVFFIVYILLKTGLLEVIVRAIGEWFRDAF